MSSRNDVVACGKGIGLSTAFAYQLYLLEKEETKRPYLRKNSSLYTQNFMSCWGVEE
jgi:hypothetical protein